MGRHGESTPWAAIRETIQLCKEIDTEVIERRWDCPAGAETVFMIVVDGGHSWPSSEFSKSIAAQVGHTTDQLDGTRDAWEFLREHHRVIDEA